MEPEYLTNFPKRMIGIYLDSGGGGGGTQTTQAQMMPWNKYVPKVTAETYNTLLPQVAKSFQEGLTPQEKSQYTRDILSNTARTFAGNRQELAENLTRSGVGGGGAAEAFGDLARSKAISGAMGLSGLTTADIQKKQQNREEVRKWIGIPGSPIQTGSTTVSQPSGGSS